MVVLNYLEIQTSPQPAKGLKWKLQAAKRYAIFFAHPVRWDQLTEWLPSKPTLCTKTVALIFLMTGGQGSWQAVGFTQLLRDCSDIRDVNYKKYCLLQLVLKCMITSPFFTADHNFMLILENLIDCLDNAVSERMSTYFIENLYSGVSKIPSWLHFFNCILE